MANELDLRIMIDVILGVGGASARDRDGRIDAFDLQILREVILGLRSCPI